MAEPARKPKAAHDQKSVTPIKPAAAGAQSEVSRIQDQLRRAMEGEAWHGPAVLELLNEVPVDLAPAKPLDQAHSIWEIALHIAAWQQVIVERLNGKARTLSQEEDFPAVTDCSESAWRQTVQSVEESFDRLDQAIGKLSDADLNNPVPGKKYNVYFMLHGIVQHSLYHAGQIALLKKSSR
jgi:uncharacterized damage-inducible protein DinB